MSGTSVENSYTNWNDGEPKIEDMEEDCVTHSKYEYPKHSYIVI